MDMSLQHLELSWDYADLSIDLDLDVVCCICSNTVGLFEDVLVCKCCQNSAHQTCALSGEAAASWSCSSCDWMSEGLDQSEESNPGEINLNSSLTDLPAAAQEQTSSLISTQQTHKENPQSTVTPPCIPPLSMVYRKEQKDELWYLP